MRIFYNFGILLYKCLIFLATPFNPKAAKFIAGRKQVFSSLKKAIEPDARYIWIHVASLGEFEQGRPIMEAVKRLHPEYKLLLTFFSPSGYEVRKNYQGADIITYLPIDTDWNARKFIRIANPSLAIFIKYEFWINYLSQLKKRGIPTYIVSAIFRESQAFFKWYGGFYRRLLANYNHLFVQDQNSVNLLASIGIKNVSIAGDTRYDRVAEIARQAKKLPIIEAFKGDKKVLVAGSSWSKDENLLIPYINRNENIKFIIAPHEVKEERIREIAGKLTRPFVLYSQTTEEEVANAGCIIIDCIGLLSSIYRYGEIAYIGGGFGVGIHNTLEAAVYGMPVIFGPNYKKFMEAVELAEAGAGFPVSNEEEFTSIMDNLLNDAGMLTKTAEIARSFVSSNCGATDKVVEALFV